MRDKEVRKVKMRVVAACPREPPTWFSISLQKNHREENTCGKFKENICCYASACYDA